MADFSSNVKQKFNLLLSQMSENRWLYVNHPQSDFTRQDTGKLTFSDTMRLIIGMGKSTTNDEISEYFDLDPDRILFCRGQALFSNFLSISSGLYFLILLLFSISRIIDFSLP